MELTLGQAIGFHRELWHGIADGIRKYGICHDRVTDMKSAMMENIFPEFEDRHVTNKCFLCEFVLGRGGSGLPSCELCPMMDDGMLPKGCLGGFYKAFSNAYENADRHAAAGYAEKIAGMPIVNPAYQDLIDNGMEVPGWR